MNETSNICNYRVRKTVGKLEIIFRRGRKRSELSDDHIGVCEELLKAFGFLLRTG